MSDIAILAPRLDRDERVHLRWSMRRTGAALVVTIAALQAVAALAGVGAPVQPWIAIAFVMTCPGALLLDLERPSMFVERAMLAVGLSASLNVVLAGLVSLRNALVVPVVGLVAVATGVWSTRRAGRDETPDDEDAAVVEEFEPTTVSVIVPTRDRPELLRRTLSSIERQDARLDVRVIVVYDQSDPDLTLPAEFSELDLTLTRNHHAPGLAGARNTGLDLVETEWVAFCDDDDWWAPDRLRRQLAAVGMRDDIDFVVGGISIERGTTSTPRRLKRKRITMSDLVRDRVMEAHPSTFLVRSRAIAEYIGPVDENLPGSYAEDYDWLLRAARVRPILNVPSMIVHVQWHPNSYFGSRWETIDVALQHLLEKTPEFDDDPKGKARLLGQRAYASAALGQRQQAIDLWKQTASANWREPRLVTTGLVLSRIISADRLLNWLNAYGRGF